MLCDLEKIDLKKIKVEIVFLPNYEGFDLPSYATMQSAGIDLYAAIEEPITIDPGCSALIKTGIKIALPEGFEAQIRPRSGMALKYAVTVLNSPGTIDADYRGEIMVILINHGKGSFRVQRGDRIAQMIISRVYQITWEQVEHFRSDTDRGDGGFGSTGA